MLTCYLVRRRLGAYLDGALPEGRARTAAAHLAGCPACQGEVDALRRLRAALQRTRAVAEPDWTGFWPGVVRGIQDRREAAPVAAAAPRPVWRRPRWAFGGALAAAVLISLTIPRILTGPPSPESPIIVSSAATEHPGGSVMVYSTPEKDVTVVWVFGLE